MENGSYLTRVFSGGLASNPLVYDIPCGDTPYIVNDSTCDLETDPDNPIWPSPNPRPNATNVCVNAVVAARFGPDGVEMDEGTLAPNIEYKKCNWETGDGFQSTGCSEEVDYTFDFIDADQEFRLNTAHLEANRWYQVVVHKEVETDDEARMNSDFSWHFRTKDDEGVCPLAHLILNDLGPDPVGEINYIDETKGDNFEQYRAEPLGQDCMLLNDDDYTYLWSSANIDIATVDSVSTDTNQATAEGNGYTVIRVQAEDKVAQKGLIVNYCDESTDCTDYDGDPATGPECPESICDIETNKCTPDITDLDPADGAPGTCVSVNGCYFRDSGSIKFSDEVNAAANLCGAPWQDFQVVSEVPEGAVTGPLTLRNNYGLEATADFTVNDTVHPCLCQIYPDTGLNIHDLVNFYGYGFTSASGDQQASFNGIEAASYGTWTDTKLEQAEVPVGTTAGQARVTIDGNDSNGIAYTMDAGPPTCTTNPDPAICDPDPTLCPPDTECNTACICVEIPEGPVEGGACDGDTSTPGICDPDNELCHPDAVCQAPDCTCQWNAFTLDEWLPETETCTSGLITMQFSQPVDSVTARAVDADSQYTNIKLLKEGTEYIPGRIGVYGKFVIFSPSAALEEETSYTMKISPALESTREQTFSGFSWDFLAKGPCTLSRIGVTLLKTENGDVTNYGPPDLFTCKLLTGCEDDYDTTADGNQHHVLGIGYEAGGNPVNADFSMVLNGSYSDGVLSPLAITETTGYLEADIYPKSDLTVASGIDQIDLEATDEVYIPAEMEPHVIAQSFLAKVFICDNPWPSAGDFPFRDNDYDFETYYCMDGGLPNFNSGYNAPISPVGEDQFLRQYIMTQDLATEVGDVIGIRIMPNMEHYSPSEWYRKAFGDGAGHPYSTQIDGYEAVRDGRSLYINAAKTGGTSYTNMYIISYDQEESACNVAENSSFENGTDDWTVSGSVSIADGVGEQVDDAQSVQLTSSGSETRVSQEFTNLEIGQSYDISGWVRADFAEGNKGQVGIIAECIGLRCQGGDNDGQKCKIADDCPGGGGCSEGVVKDPACGLYKSSFDIYGSEEDPDLVNEDHPGYLPWTKVSYQVNHNSVGYRLRVSCINSTIAPGASGSGTSWCDFIQVEPSGACGISFVQQIYNQMVDNLTFNTNIGNLDESLRLRRDVKRLGQLTYINNYLERYQDNNGELPELEELDVEAGSYLRNMTTSIWPSWQWRLGNAVGKGLPVDPLHTEGICEPPYHPDTCWDEDNYKFRSRADTYVYSYVVNPDTDTARLYGHFEYPTNWDCEVFPFSDNPCPVASDCICEGGDCGFNRYIKVNELCPAP